VSLDLLDWRRRTHTIYAAVRASADPAEAHAHWVADRTELMRSHPQSADRDVSLRHAPYDPAWRAVLAVDTEVEPAHVDLPSATNGIVPFDRIGVVHHPLAGPLSVWWLGSYGGGVWLPLRDASPDTYGGGRYVLDTVKGADLGGGATIVVDLNYAYNPSCAYDPAWACPLAPAGNVTGVAVPVGELLPA
jgi:hypothetical protein